MWLSCNGIDMNAEHDIEPVRQIGRIVHNGVYGISVNAQAFENFVVDNGIGIIIGIIIYEWNGLKAVVVTVEHIHATIE